MQVAVLNYVSLYNRDHYIMGKENCTIKKKKNDFDRAQKKGAKSRLVKKSIFSLDAKKKSLFLTNIALVYDDSKDFNLVKSIKFCAIIIDLCDLLLIALKGC